MKTKINKWGNSHGIRLSAAVLEHLNVENGNQVEIKMTKNGVELVKKNNTISDFKQRKTKLIADLIGQTSPVKEVNDPNIEYNWHYIVIDINPSQLIIREVEKNCLNTFKTLSDAKYAARKIVNKTIAEGKSTLIDIRQTGIKTIRYINL